MLNVNVIDGSIEVWRWQIVIPRYIIQPMDVKIAYILMYVMPTQCILKWTEDIFLFSMAPFVLALPATNFSHFLQHFTPFQKQQDMFCMYCLDRWVLVCELWLDLRVTLVQLGRELFTHLKVYKGPNHPHEAQQPIELPIRDKRIQKQRQVEISNSGLRYNEQFLFFFLPHLPYFQAFGLMGFKFHASAFGRAKACSFVFIFCLQRYLKLLLLVS